MERIPKAVHEVLDTYFIMIETKLPNSLEGYYLYGSISLGAFKDGCSDIDFMAVMNRKISGKEIHVLKEIHREMKKKFPKQSLDGFYSSKDEMSLLQTYEMMCARFNDGEFEGMSKFDKNSIDAYQLKEYGITIKGNKAEDIAYTVDWNTILYNVHENLNTYWFRWIEVCKKFPYMKFIRLFFSLSMIEWGVLGISRVYYTFKEKDITSKVGAGEYTLNHVPAKWHKIINESMRLRNGNTEPFYNSIFERRQDALDYMEFILMECNKTR